MATDGESSGAKPAAGGSFNAGQDRKQRFGGNKFQGNNMRKKGRGGRHGNSEYVQTNFVVIFFIPHDLEYAIPTKD